MRHRYYYFFIVVCVPALLSSCTAYFTISQKEIDQVTYDYDHKCVTSADYMKMKSFYKSLILGGEIIYPEASKIVSHYLFGNGTDLYIKSAYFFKSDTIIKAIKKMTQEIYGPVTLSIQENPRIAYAMNGFYLYHKDMKLYIMQHIQFSASVQENAYTTFPRITDTLYVPDRLIHIFDSTCGCKPFTVYIYH